MSVVVLSKHPNVNSRSGLSGTACNQERVMSRRSSVWTVLRGLDLHVMSPKKRVVCECSAGCRVGLNYGGFLGSLLGLTQFPRLHSQSASVSRSLLETKSAFLFNLILETRHFKAACQRGATLRAHLAALDDVREL